MIFSPSIYFELNDFWLIIKCVDFLYLSYNELLKGKDRRIICFFFIIRSIHKAEHPLGCLTEPFICYFAVISDLSTCTRTIMPFEPDCLSSEGCRLLLKLVLINSESFLESPIKISRLPKKKGWSFKTFTYYTKKQLVLS